MKNITVEWTGKYPNLCNGRWIIIIDGQEVKCDKDNYDSILGEEMNTYGNYRRWNFSEDWDVEWNTHTDGEKYKSWIKLDSTKELLKLIEDNCIYLEEQDIENLYNKLNEKDWRSGSCGGCV